MINLPLFPIEKNIAENFDPNAEIVLYKGDVADLLATIPDNSINLIVSSPPYNLGKSYELANPFRLIYQIKPILSVTWSEFSHQAAVYAGKLVILLTMGK